MIGDGHKRQRQQKLVKFLRQIDREFSGSIQLHLVIDTYGTHRTDEVQAWLKQHPRYVLHSVPTGSSWLNLMERWFAAMTRTRVRPDSFLSVEDLTAAIEQFLSHSFDDDSYIKERPKPPPLRINNLGWAKLNRRNGPSALAKRNYTSRFPNAPQRRAGCGLNNLVVGRAVEGSMPSPGERARRILRIRFPGPDSHLPYRATRTKLLARQTLRVPTGRLVSESRKRLHGSGKPG